MKRSFSKSAADALCCAVLLLYIPIVAADVFRAAVPFDGALKLAGVVLCAACAAVLLPRGRDAVLVFAAAALTVAADAILLFLPAWYAAGMGIFCAAQTVRLSLFAPLPLKKASALCGAEIALIGILLCGAPALYAVSTVYALLLLANLFFAFKHPARPGARRLRRTGIVLFALCDVCVALYNLLPGASPLCAVAASLMWVFYLPSQLLLANEGRFY